MKSSPARIAEALQGFRAAFGAGDFRPKDVIAKPELEPILRKLVGRRGDVRKKLGRWLRRHRNEQAGELKLAGEYMSHKRRWLWCIEHPNDGPTAEEFASAIEQGAERLRVKLQRKIGKKTGTAAALAEIEFAQGVLDRNKAEDAKLEERAEEARIKEANREIAHERKLAERAAQRAAEQWAVEIKCPSRRLPEMEARLRRPEDTGLPVPVLGESIEGGEPGLLYALCSKARVGELAAKFHAIAREYRGRAFAVVVGETIEQRRLREVQVRRVAREARRSRQPDAIESCASDRAALYAAVGIDSRPGAPGFPGRVCAQLIAKKDWFNP